MEIPSLLVKAALETMLSVIMAKLSGANLVHNEGYMESGLGCFYEMVAMTNVKGIEVNQDTLVADELHQVGPGGHFLDTENTLARFRDYWYLTLLDRQSAAIGSTVGA